MRPNGLAIDAKNRRLFSGCNGNSKMVVMDADKGTVIATVDIGRGSDGCGFDPAKGLAYSANGGDGTVTVIGEAGGEVQGRLDDPDPVDRADDGPRSQDASALSVRRLPAPAAAPAAGQGRPARQCPGFIRDRRGRRLTTASMGIFPAINYLLRQESLGECHPYGGGCMRIAASELGSNLRRTTRPADR